MEELKQLIKEDKELIRTLDEHLLVFRETVTNMNNAISLFTQFFERQDRFMSLMSKLLQERK